jgi:hypothetical protein
MILLYRSLVAFSKKITSHFKVFIKKSATLQLTKLMRKLVAIIMLSIFTFNIAGYQLIYNYMESCSDAALEQVLDEKGYNESELISIKQATNLPYYTNNETFQRIDGEVEIDGIKYKYVKSRIYNDSLEMLCIPHRAKMKIEQSRNDYAQGAHDFQQNNTQKKSGSKTDSFGKNLNEYEEQSFLSVDCDSKLLANNYVLVNSVSEKTLFFTTVEQPPDAA